MRSDKVFKIVLLVFGFLILFFSIGIFIQLSSSAWLSIKQNGVSFLFKSVWDPNKDVYGALPFLIGTFITALLSVFLSLPLSIGTSLFLSDYVKGNFSNIISSLIDLLASIPSVVYGLWGLFMLVPYIRILENWLFKYAGFIPLFNSKPYGVGILSATVVLLIMILPYSISVIKEVLKMVPDDLKEAGYALGANKWEVMQKIVLPYIKSGIFAGTGLSLGRALGETMAVTMVIGNRNAVPTSLFDPANTLASVIANEFYEASSASHVSSLIYLALILFVFSFLVNFTMQLILRKINTGMIKK
ncbi:phosphate ABC transporter permease subunit PstC [bacterium]|nr:phosphate ABC transporter permease subunit PstC [bacterium]